MGLLEDLGYELKPPNGFQRGIQKIASSRAGAKIFSKLMHPVDKVLFNVSSGEVTLPGLLARLPVIMLITTGAKSGKVRSMPLLGIPIGDDLAIIGSNFGQESTPGWVYNLEADPSASVKYRDRTVAVAARRSSEDETDRIYEQTASIYPGFAKYRSRADHREIRVFVLETAG